MEEDESQSGGSQSSVSYDEASYDGRAGKIEYSCQDDEVIAAGVPGATMYDQDIRETSVSYNVLLVLVLVLVVVVVFFQQQHKSKYIIIKYNTTQLFANHNNYKHIVIQFVLERR